MAEGTIEEKLPAISEADIKHGFPTSAPMAPGLAVFFNDNLYARCAKLSGIMSRAEGVVPKHLLGKPEACFAVISRAITWNLDVFAVAMATYQTPGGAIGYSGALIQAILENSGRLVGNVKYEHKGDWSKVKGKFKIAESPKGGKYPVPTWTREEAAGLYVTVSAQVKGEVEPRTLDVYLDTAFPLNSPLWATAPDRQICYLGARAFGNIAMPGIMFGVPFDVDPTGFYGEPMQDITPPRPTKPGSEFERKPKDADPRKEPETKQENGASEKPQDSQSQPASQDTAKPEAASVEPAQKEQPAKEAKPRRKKGGDANSQEAATRGTGEGSGTNTPPPAEPEAKSGASSPKEETAMARGIRLLALCRTIPDVADLRQSIKEELEEAKLTAELEQWDRKGGLCDQRTDAITKGSP